MVLRSDEAANEAEIERDKNFRSNAKKGVATAATLAGAATGGGIFARIAPLLSEYIPVDLAMKGISKISPKIGQFLKKGQSMGLDVKEGLDFLKSKMVPKEEQAPQNPKENRNVIKQYSPDLHQFLEGEIGKGRSVLEAGAAAQGNKSFKHIISMLTKDHKTPWSAILKTVYGEGTTKQQAVKGFNEHKKKGIVEQETERFQNEYVDQAPPASQQQGQSSGPGQQALMEILKKINQSLGQ